MEVVLDGLLFELFELFVLCLGVLLLQFASVDELFERAEVELGQVECGGDASV